MKAARDAASAEMARSGDVQRAGAAYAGVLGVRPGDTFSKPSFLGSLFGAEPGVVRAAPAAPTATSELVPSKTATLIIYPRRPNTRSA